MEIFNNTTRVVKDDPEKMLQVGSRKLSQQHVSQLMHIMS